MPWHYGSPMVPNILEDEYMLMVETFTNFDKITYGLRVVWGRSVDSNKMDALGGRLPKRDGSDHAGLQLCNCGLTLPASRCILHLPKQVPKPPFRHF